MISLRYTGYRSEARTSCRVTYYSPIEAVLTMRESTKPGREREIRGSGERGGPGDSRSSDRPSLRRRWHRAVRRRRLARADRLGSVSRGISKLRRRRRKAKDSVGGAREPFRLILASWSKSWRRRRARRRSRAQMNTTFSVVPASWSKSWRTRRARRRARAGSKVAFTLVPAVWSKRWRQWRSHRRVIRSARSARRIVPASWLRRWRRWRGGATKRALRRREQLRALVPAVWLSWWKRQNSAQRAKVRSRVVLGVSAVAVLVFASVIFQGPDPGPAEVAVGNGYVREEAVPITVLVPVPLVTARAATTPRELLVRSRAEIVAPTASEPLTTSSTSPKPVITIPRVVARYKCGTAAFESALTSAYGPDSIGNVACTGFYGIGTVNSSGPAAPGGIGFFGVDNAGFWRLVSMIQSDGDVAASLPTGFPPSLLKFWSTL